MEYEDLRKLFHISEADANQAYEERRANKESALVGLHIAGHPGFYCMDSEIYKLILTCERLDKLLQMEIAQLPPIALRQYLNSTLIEEIVLTNEIEGVHSSHQEIGEILEKLEQNDRNRRFHGIVEKYNALTGQNEISIRTCKDLRSLYDDLVLNEVIMENPKNNPDGEYFRAGPVSVLDGSGIPIHQGIEPESAIIQYMNQALEILNDKNTELLVRISLFHFLFAYAHPFYDGNGRTNRFVSSYLIANEFSPIVGFRLSHAIKQQIEHYYKAFSLCEHPLNMGDLTPFIIIFSEIIATAMKDMVDTLKEKIVMLNAANEALASLPGIGEKKGLAEIGSILIQATLFADIGVSMRELKSITGLSEPTINKRLAYFSSLSLAKKTKRGRNVYHFMDIEALTRLSESS